ncbi:MAG: hypothetical protein ACRDD1_17065, partial [Planctomycetia bacterium]
MSDVEPRNEPRLFGRHDGSIGWPRNRRAGTYLTRVELSNGDGAETPAGVDAIPEREPPASPGAGGSTLKASLIVAAVATIWLFGASDGAVTEREGRLLLGADYQPTVAEPWTKDAEVAKVDGGYVEAVRLLAEGTPFGVDPALAVRLSAWLCCTAVLIVTTATVYRRNGGLAAGLVAGAFGLLPVFHFASNDATPDAFLAMVFFTCTLGAASTSSRGLRNALLIAGPMGAACTILWDPLSFAAESPSLRLVGLTAALLECLPLWPLAVGLFHRGDDAASRRYRLV